MSNAPIKNFKDGWFSAGVFRGEYDGKPSYNVSLQKGFKRKESDKVEYQSISVFHEDLLKLANLCEMAYWEILRQKENDYQANKGQTAQQPTARPVSAPTMNNNDEIPF